MEEVKYIPKDLVMIDNDVCQVKGVRKRNGLIRNVVEAKVISRTENRVRAVDESSIEPMLLTPAILEANGWKKNEYGVYYKNFNPHKSVCLVKEDCNNWEVSTGGVALIHCKFVHQLQHLLFGLRLNSELKV